MDILPQDFLTGIIPKDKNTESAGALRLHTANIDSLAFQAALVGLVYVLTYAVIKNFGRLFPADVASMLWGFFFFGGLGLAFLVRQLMEKFGIAYLIDAGVQRRITGWSIDFLIVSTVMAIQLVLVNSTVWWNWSVSLTVIIFFCAMVLTLLTLKILKLWGSPKF